MTDSPDLGWSVPVMRAGYAGRGLVYAIVAGFSLYAVWQGHRAESTSSALGELETTVWGGIVLFLIFIGLLAYAIWRLVDSIYDLENYGSDAKGTVARIGMIVTGLIHGGVGLIAFSLLFGDADSDSSGGSSVSSGIATVMTWPGGRWIVGCAGLATIGAGAYYAHKGWKERYRRHLRANHFTMKWNWLLKAGVLAQGVVVGIIGALFVQAALRANPNEAGGVGKAFNWLTGQPYGQILVGVICAGLLGFALFCFVNAAYRVVPKVAGDDIETLAARLKAKASGAV